MLTESLSALCRIVDGAGEGLPRGPVEAIETDTRRAFRERSVFVALRGENHDATAFLGQARDRGAIAAIVPEAIGAGPEGLPLIRVADPLHALQALAGHHRARMRYPILAVTGSNGKTILKDLVSAILTRDRTVIASPGSYNSQVGVALSLLRLEADADLAVIEAGISRLGEMDRLQAMIRPDYGILTNIGMAHLEGFGSRGAIAEQKLRLFRELPERGWLLHPADPILEAALPDLTCPTHVFGRDPDLPRITAVDSLETGRGRCRVLFPDGVTHQITLEIDASFREVFATVEAAFSAAWLLGVSADQIAAASEGQHPPHARLEIRRAPSGSILVNDAYSSDPVSAKSSLGVFDHYPGRRRIFVFGGMTELGESSAYEHRIVAEEAARLEVDVLLTVGDLARVTAREFEARRPGSRVRHFGDVAALTDHAASIAGDGDVIVVKGPRRLHLEQIATRLEVHLSRTVYYIDLSRIRDNLMAFRERIPARTRIMVMLKAFAYGTDAGHIARYLQEWVSHFGVAYTKEAVALRRAGVTCELMVQLIRPEDAEEVVASSLQPAVFEIETVRALGEAAKRAGKKVRVHIKVDTGMGRFGVFLADLPELLDAVRAQPNLVIEGLMTHFASADDPDDDAFTREQIARFERARRLLAERGIEPPLIHAAATSAAVRLPETHYTMIRIGLGVYGIYPSEAVARDIALTCPIALVSKIGSLKTYPAGTPVSYNRRFQTARESRIAFLPIGYHDGLSRALSNKGYVLIRGKRAPIVGSVCMDFTPIDITGIPEAGIGDEALVFGAWRGAEIRVEEIARLEGTIPYEVLCRLSDRIQRIYLLDD